MSRNAFAQCEREYNEREERLDNIRQEREWSYLPSTSYMLETLNERFGVAEAREMIQAKRNHGEIGYASAIAILYKALGDNK